ncbi:hypothetical protein AB0C04_02295 [Micromonospora sp. NPDC048909]|uniref:hypothetical protein n=1 Tax=Micromonospora sp. NPDC048909 TaxID=3155643 RepID=UPI0033C35C05
MTTHADRMFAELDRQLEHVRVQCDAIASRAGFLIATTAVAAAVLAARIQTGKLNVAGALWALGIAGALGVMTLVPLLHPGPRLVAVQRWAAAAGEKEQVDAVTELFLSKMLTLEGNRSRLLVMTVAFYLQGSAVVLAVVLALMQTMGK